MDLKYWSKVKPQTIILALKRKMFGKYYYKVELHARGVGVLRWYTDLKDIKDYLGRRGGMGFSQPRDLCELGKIYREFKNSDQHVVRISDPRIAFYFETEAEVKEFCKSIPKRINVLSITGPKSEEELEALRSNKVILKNPVEDYAYCVTLKPGWYTPEDKKVLLNLIENLEAKASSTLVFKLNRDRALRSRYKIYIKTEEDYTWMRMSLKPQHIGKINQLHFTNK